MDDETTIPMPTPIFDFEATVRVASQATQKAREDRASPLLRSVSLQPQSAPSRPSVVVGELTPTWRTPRVSSELVAIVVGVVSLLSLWAGVAALRRVTMTAPSVAAGAAVVAAPPERTHERPVEPELAIPTPSGLAPADEGASRPPAATVPEAPRATRPTRRSRPARAPRTEASIASAPSRSNERAVVTPSLSASPADRTEPESAPLVDAPTAPDSGATDSGATDAGERAPATPELVVTPDF